MPGAGLRLVSAAEPGFEADRRKGWELALGGNPGSALHQWCESAGGPVGDARGKAPIARHPGKESDRIGRQRAKPALVVVRQELSLESGHVDIDRALGLTRLACKA